MLNLFAVDVVVVVVARCSIALYPILVPLLVCSSRHVNRIKSYISCHTLWTQLDSIAEICAPSSRTIDHAGKVVKVVLQQQQQQPARDWSVLIVQLNRFSPLPSMLSFYVLWVCKCEKWIHSFPLKTAIASYLRPFSCSSPTKRRIAEMLSKSPFHAPFRSVYTFRRCASVLRVSSRNIYGENSAEHIDPRTRAINKTHKNSIMKTQRQANLSHLAQHEYTDFQFAIQFAAKLPAIVHRRLDFPFWLAAGQFSN